ncbi:aspartate--tRNA ligase [bacterium]|nr:aspartate--tRNA ligase [bacterium]
MIEPWGERSRTHSCGELRRDDIGHEVVLAGWMHSRRDHGGVIFIDLRDRDGITQIVFNPENDSELHRRAGDVRGEWVLSVRGAVRERPEGTVNPDLPTGEVELVAGELLVLNISRTPPFAIEDEVNADESLRLRHRYLDLRRPKMMNNLIFRHRAMQAIRDQLNAGGFIEVETPVLTKSTPEGARDYLVPSRVNPGRFFALPQSPQLFKQLLMVSGLDRYYQIVRCFRDEDLRADRQPEFTQLDVEMSFINRDGLFSLIEDLLAGLFAGLLGRELPRPVPRLTYAEAMARYGVDNPDVRFAMEIVDLTEIAAGVQFKVFSGAVASGGTVRALRGERMAEKLSRKDIDDLTELVKLFGAKGLAWVKVGAGDAWESSPIAKFFTDEERGKINERCAAAAGDIIFFLADREKVVCEGLGRLRLDLARRFDLIPEGKMDLVWITEFPLLEYNEEEKRLEAKHHPFTAPMEEDLHLLEGEPLKVRAQAYDIVLNGEEIGGGSLRIYQTDLQRRMFSALNIAEDEAESKFGFLLEAFQYGAPPHGGIALGLDRLLAIMTGSSSIREVIAFPKTQRATCQLTGAPSSVDMRQLRDLHLKTDIPPEKKQ